MRPVLLFAAISATVLLAGCGDSKKIQQLEARVVDAQAMAAESREKGAETSEKVNDLQDKVDDLESRVEDLEGDSGDDDQTRTRAAARAHRPSVARASARMGDRAMEVRRPS
jgi:outer membrane murein-binding lipoprotein Lpp